MKDFLKFTLATVTGIILSSIVLFIINRKKEFCNDARLKRNVG